MSSRLRLGVLSALFLAVLLSSGCASTGSRRAAADPFLPSQPSPAPAPAWQPAPAPIEVRPAPAPIEVRPAPAVEQRQPQTVITPAPEARSSQAAPESFGLKASADEKSSVQIVPSRDGATDTLAFTPALAAWLIGGAAVVLAIAGFVMLRK